MTLEGRDFDLTKLPNWLIESGYIGDNSITPDLEGQGLMTILVQEMIQRFPHAFIVGITGESNIGMQKVFEKTGATISNHFPYFVRPSNPRAISKEIGNSSFEHIPLFIDTKYPPVIHLFQNKDGLLICGAIGTTPNFPNRSTATHEGNSELFPNQIVGFINPEVELSPTELDSIYGKIARFKYLSLFQLNNKAGENSKSLQSGYEQGWVTALYQR